MPTDPARVGRNEAWFDEAVGVVKQAVPMATADAVRVVDAAIKVFATHLGTIEWGDDLDREIDALRGQSDV